ncbi:hypothetical protein K440DRAFT_621115 [Wilcoxina mikolae CBS 423.85]|nr:hypothetical protein K440DRAFT_621115 [Wilcoxina mikolae CBS 423.85]
MKLVSLVHCTKASKKKTDSTKTLPAGQAAEPPSQHYETSTTLSSLSSIFLVLSSNNHEARLCCASRLLVVCGLARSRILCPQCYHLRRTTRSFLGHLDLLHLPSHLASITPATPINSITSATSTCSVSPASSRLDLDVKPRLKAWYTDSWPVHIVGLAVFAGWLTLSLFVCGVHLMVFKLEAVYKAIKQGLQRVNTRELVPKSDLVSWVHVTLWVLRCVCGYWAGLPQALITTKGPLSTTSAWYLAFTAVGLYTVPTVLTHHGASEAYSPMVTNTLVGLVGIMLISHTVIANSCTDSMCT